jgi:serine/threonine-protein kinase
MGRYVVRFKIAQGGMGAVYLAQLETSAGFKKWVALKTIDEKMAKDRLFIKMFMDEARLTARIDHPNVCTVFDFGEEKGTYFLAMEYLHGESLNTLMRRATSAQQQLPLPVVARIIADAARGLHAAHEMRLDDGTPARLVHRDISPHNVFVLYDGVAKVVDFGVAHLGHSHDRAGTLAGKLPYMSPEQLRLEPIDRRSDIWSLGVVLWEASLGQRLFKRDTDEATEDAVLKEAIAGPRVYRAGYTRELEGIVMKALARDVTQRFQTAAEMARALEQYLATCGEPTGMDEVAAVMQLHFAERIASRDRSIRSVSVDQFGPMPDDDTTRAPGPATIRMEVNPPRLGGTAERKPSRIWGVLGTLLSAAFGLSLIGGAAYMLWKTPRVEHPSQEHSSIVPFLGQSENHGTTTVASDAAVPTWAPRVVVQTVNTRVVPANAGYLTIQGGVRGGTVSEGGLMFGTLPLRRFALGPGRHVIRVQTGPGATTRTLIANIRPGSEFVQTYPPARP